jgi:hypothetical protein
MISARTDVWALGIVLHELLTGERPYEGTAPEVERAVCSPDAAPTACGTLAIDAGLATIVAKCLNKRPSERFETAGAVADALEKWAHRAEAAQPSAKARRRRWLPALRVATAAMVLILVAAALANRSWRTTPSAPGNPEPESEEVMFNRMTEPSAEAVKAGKSVTLVSPDTVALHHLWRTGGGASFVRLAEDAPDGGPVFVSSRTAGLLELLNISESGSYRVTAEIRQESAFENDANLGIYVARQEWVNAQGGQHTFARCVFADLGRHATQFADPDRGNGSQVQFGPGLLGPSPLNPARGHFSQTPAMWYAPSGPLNPPGPWRTLSVEVRFTGARAHWSGERVGDCEIGAWRDWFELLPSLHRDLAGLGGRESFAGGLGVYVYGASLTLRRFIVEPLDE